MFRIGQKVVCIANGWFVGMSNEIGEGPAKNEIVTITGFTSCKFINERLILKEWPHPEGYGAGNFRPLADRDWETIHWQYKQPSDLS